MTLLAATESLDYDPVTDATLPLWDAVLCSDCDTLRHVDRRGRDGHVCPSCGSRHSVSLVRLLEGRPSLLGGAPRGLATSAGRARWRYHRQPRRPAAPLDPLSTRARCRGGHPSTGLASVPPSE
jgi:hypothetical protein